MQANPTSSNSSLSTLQPTFPATQKDSSSDNSTELNKGPLDKLSKKTVSFSSDENHSQRTELSLVKKTEIPAKQASVDQQLKQAFYEIRSKIVNGGEPKDIEVLLAQHQSQFSGQEAEAFTEQILAYRAQEHDWTLLESACNYGSPKVVESLLQKGAKVNEADESGDTPIWRAMLNEKDPEKIVKLLLDHEAEVNAENYDQETPLHAAARNSSVGVCQLLIDRGAKVNAENYDQETPLHVAKSKKRKDIVQYIQKRNTKELLYDAVKNGDVDEVKRLLKGKLVNVNYAAGNDYTALHYVCESLNNVETQLRSESGLNNNEKTSLKQKKKAYLKIAELLIKHGASKTLTTIEGKIPFQMLSQGKSLSALENYNSLQIRKAVNDNKLIDKINCFFDNPKSNHKEEKYLADIPGLVKNMLTDNPNFRRTSGKQ